MFTLIPTALPSWPTRQDVCLCPFYLSALSVKNTSALAWLGSFPFTTTTSAMRKCRLTQALTQWNKLFCQLFPSWGNWIKTDSGLLDQLILVYGSQLWTLLPYYAFNDIVLLAWTRPWWEHLHQGNWQTSQIRDLGEGKSHSPVQHLEQTINKTISYLDTLFFFVVLDKQALLNSQHPNRSSVEIIPVGTSSPCAECKYLSSLVLLSFLH